MNIAPLPSIPKLIAPPGAANCHAHIMGPFDRFPLPDKPGYLPPLAPVEDFVAGLDRLRFTRGVVVQSSTHGKDCRVLLDALQRYPARLRAVGLADEKTPDGELEGMAAAGVRGLRFTGNPFPGRRSGGHSGSVHLESLFAMAPKLKPLGLHAQLWMHCHELLEWSPRLLKLGIPLVLDHMGRFDPERGLEDRGFQHLVALLKTGWVWIKLIPQRNSERFPDYQDVRPFQEALIHANPDRLVWGSDWPHTNSGDQMPDDGRLLDLFGEWVPDAALQKAILATNPAALYGFPAP